MDATIRSVRVGIRRFAEWNRKCYLPHGRSLEFRCRGRRRQDSSNLWIRRRSRTHRIWFAVSNSNLPNAHVRREIATNVCRIIHAKLFGAFVAKVSPPHHSRAMQFINVVLFCECHLYATANSPIVVCVERCCLAPNTEHRRAEIDIFHLIKCRTKRNRGNAHRSAKMENFKNNLNRKVFE